MKATTIFMLSAVLILFYCLTTQGRHNSGTWHGKSGVARRIEHGDSPGPHQGGRKSVICICNQKNGHNLSRKRRHMSAHHKSGPHSPGCARICMRKSGRGGSVHSIPLS